MAKIRFFQRARDETRLAETNRTDERATTLASGHAATPYGTDVALLLLQNFEQSCQGWFWATDDAGRLTYLTQGVAITLGSAAHGIFGSAFTDHFVRDDEGMEVSRTLSFIMAKRTSFEKLTLRTRSADDDRWWLVSGSAQFDQAGRFTGYLGSGVDITEQRSSSQRASQLAMYDPLTGLPNRRCMASALETNLAVLRYQQQPCCLLLIDLDRFKQVNDTLGHPAGDDLLKQVGDRLLRIVGDREKIFRLGGDEFQILLPNAEDRGLIGHLATQIIESLSQPYSIDGSRCVIGASIGVVVAPVDGSTAEELIRNVDLALYAAKTSGRGRFRFFSSDLLHVAEQKRLLEEDLRDALANDEIKLFYQPIVSARSNCVTGVEALIRWTHPTRGPISPALFIPVAEEANLIEQIGEWVIRKACEDVATWPGALRVAVNVSPIQFANEALPKIVMSALAASGLPAGRLELELTEGVFLSEGAETDSMFAILKTIGVRLALDDFGTGYSSLGYLKTAPFDKIKIDQSFVRGATAPGSRNGAIIAAIVALAEALGMETTAEGIESHDQLDLIRALRVSHVQGYIYSKAVASDEVAARLASGDWSIEPVGPARQRSERQSMYRSAGAIVGNRYHPIVIRNLSETGALIEGLADVAPDARLLIDFGDGQLSIATVRRVNRRQTGLEFGLPLVNDGDGGLCTSRRVAADRLDALGLPTFPVPNIGYVWDETGSLTVEQLAATLGIGLSPSTTPPQPFLGFAAAPDPAEEDRRAIPTVEQFAHRYLDHLAGRKRPLAFHQAYVRDHILPTFGRFRLDEIAESDVAAWLARTVGPGPDGKAIGSRLRGLMSHMFAMARHWDVPGAGSNPVPLLARPSADLAREPLLAPDDLLHLQEAAEASPNPQLKFIVSLLLLTSLRIEELENARWTDIDLDARLWRIASAKADRFHSVPLSPAAIEVIRQLPRWDGCAHVIVNPRTRKPYHSFFKSWDAVRKKAGLPNISLHDLRRHVAAG